MDFKALLLKSIDSSTSLLLSPHSFWINKTLENTSHTSLINISSFFLIVGTVGITNNAHDRFAIYLFVVFSLFLVKLPTPGKSTITSPFFRISMGL